MYFPFVERVEMRPKRGPFFELMLQPLLPLGHAWAEMVVQVLSLVFLALTLVLGRRILELATGRSAPRWIPLVAFLLLAPFVHLAMRYTQTSPMQVFLLTAGFCLMMKGRWFQGGLVWSLPIAIKIMPVVLVPLLIWKRAWGAVGGVVVGLLLTTAAVLVHQGVSMGLGQFESLYHALRRDSAFESYHERFQGLPSIVMATTTPTYAKQLDSAAQDIDWNGSRNFLGGTSLHEHSGLLLGLGSVLIVAVCALACRPRRNDSTRRWLGETGLVLLAMLLLSPHTWKHYLWYLYPAVLLALAEVRDRQRWAVGFLVVTVITLTLPHKGSMPMAWAHAYGVFHGYGIGMLALLGILAARLQSRRNDEQG